MSYVLGGASAVPFSSLMTNANRRVSAKLNSNAVNALPLSASVKTAFLQRPIDTVLDAVVKGENALRWVIRNSGVPPFSFMGVNIDTRLPNPSTSLPATQRLTQRRLQTAAFTLAVFQKNPAKWISTMARYQAQFYRGAVMGAGKEAAYFAALKLWDDAEKAYRMQHDAWQRARHAWENSKPRKNRVQKWGARPGVKEDESDTSYNLRADVILWKNDPRGKIPEPRKIPPVGTPRPRRQDFGLAGLGVVDADGYDPETGEYSFDDTSVTAGDGGDMGNGEAPPTSPEDQQTESKNTEQVKVLIAAFTTVLAPHLIKLFTESLKTAQAGGAGIAKDIAKKVGLDKGGDGGGGGGGPGSETLALEEDAGITKYLFLAAIGLGVAKWQKWI